MVPIAPAQDALAPMLVIGQIFDGRLELSPLPFHKLKVAVDHIQQVALLLGRVTFWLGAPQDREEVGPDGRYEWLGPGNLTAAAVCLEQDLTQLLNRARRLEEPLQFIGDGSGRTRQFGAAAERAYHLVGKTLLSTHVAPAMDAVTESMAATVDRLSFMDQDRLHLVEGCKIRGVEDGEPIGNHAGRERRPKARGVQ